MRRSNKEGNRRRGLAVHGLYGGAAIDARRDVMERSGTYSGSSTEFEPDMA